MKMKKISIIGALCIIIVLALTGCGKKKAITTSEFISKTESLGFTTTDATSQYAEFDHVKEATIAQHPDGYQIEFYSIDNEANTKGMFTTNKNTFEASKGNGSAESSVSLGNYATYSLTSDGSYMYLCRVDTTLLYIHVEDTYKDSVKDVIKELGY